MAIDTEISPVTGSASSAPHPLDPLTGAEIEAAAAVVKAADGATDSMSFVMISLHEPPKKADLTLEALPRSAFCVAYDTAAKLLVEVVVDLEASVVSSWTPVPGRFPSYLMEHMEGVEEQVVKDERWQAAMRLRGVEDFSLAMVDPWPAGYYGPQDAYADSPLICRPLTFMRAAPGEHGYARPVEGLIVTFNMDTMEVMEVEDHGVVPLPPMAGNYSERFMWGEDKPGENRPDFSGFRDGVKPIEITQPEGPSFSVDGWKVEWQKWSLRVGFNPREGLVLHQLTYTDRGEERPIMHRAALAEMVVPYGDTAPTHWNKNVFDMGEVGMGFSANSLTLGCDCLGEIFYFDAVFNDAQGRAVELPNAICMHEEDYGISWKHTDFRTGEVEVRRSRRLVISTIATVGNYEYGFFWYLYNDASIELEIKLTGVLTTGSIAVGEKPRHGNLVAPGIYGPHHQHAFSFRLDMTIDGPGNSLVQVDSVPEPDPALNPHHNAWITKETVVDTEGGYDWDYSTARYWKVVNPSKVNELGSPVAYKFIPRDPVPSMVQEGSYIYDRARFVQHAVWASAYDPTEQYSAGKYPYQTSDVQGLPDYVAGGDDIADGDLVLWPTVTAHHIVRPEDWPVMPCAYVGFHLKPMGFFDGNPALDLPPSPAACHTGKGGCGDGCSCC
ncbi:primary-amine oxidase [Nocardioides sp. GY 10127]|uniref:primary-amine oxidase n=1 Tax=Nocardioides sp. GY 10127 TaxID=2569762 RepID=UPI0010A81170|nr:primary-amine oxidase [Nocardioides sp. GY 10127]TIC82672.1 primary-amine oxidase [Nocardioides sp. GY 10127]